jgi:membrane protease YdiL (CAAX protease family)
MTDEVGKTRPQSAAKYGSSHSDETPEPMKFDWFAAARIPTGPGWKDLAAALAIVWGLFLGLQILTFIVLEFTIGPNWNDDLKIGHVFPAITLSWLGTLVTIWYFSCWKYWKRIDQAFALRVAARKTIVQSVLIGVVCAIIFASIIGFLAPEGAEESQIVKFATKETGEGGGDRELSVLFAVVALAFPFLEEIYYRGFLYGVFEGLLGKLAAATVVTIWFGLVHAPQVGFSIVVISAIMIFGALLTYLRYRYDSLIPPLAAHVAYNATVVIALAIS